MIKRKIKSIAAILMAASIVTGCTKAVDTDGETIKSDDFLSDVTVSESIDTVEDTESPVGETFISENSSEESAVSISDQTEIPPAASAEEDEEDKEGGGFMGGFEETPVPETDEPEPEETTAVQVQIDPNRVAQEVGVGQEIATSYAFTTLTDSEKQLYNEIKRAAFALEPTVDIESLGYTEDEWSKIFSIVYYQEPEIFWLDPYMIPGELYYKTNNVEEIEAMKKEIDNAMVPLIEEAVQEKTIVDRVKFIHDYLIKIDNFQKDGGASYSPTIYGGLVLNTPQCEGYAKTFTYVCNKVGIESMVITGNVASGASHAWNKVKVDGDWYNIDLTNDDPILQVPNSKHIRYTYFLVPDAWIKDKTHFRENLSHMFSSIEFFPAPAANSADFNYFNYYDKVYDSFDEAKAELLSRMINAAKNKDAIVQIKVSSPEIYDQLNNTLIELKDETKDQTGVIFSRIAAVCDQNQLITGISFEY